MELYSSLITKTQDYTERFINNFQSKQVPSLKLNLIAKNN